MTRSGRERILVAVDTPELDRARGLVDLLGGHVGGFKIGLELFVSHGPRFVEAIVGGGSSVFLDLKLHDIPNTVAGAARAAGRLGVAFLTMHASGGVPMMRRAVEAANQGAESAGLAPPLALAVTVLTSLDDDELARVGLAGGCGSAVTRLAGLAREAGVGGIVCSPREIGAVRRVFPQARLVVPGVRPAGAPVLGDDQSRVATPGTAVAAGADYLVIGRP
ncbi:MAG TPA: orotidine-5'-phosphate decarboxylase, partial [Candidatus Polarisedimenticolaceae bacterium]|nr:orotidine-5'-phosphate decarboxylase [Candidatus Polarisedimenticolaceae bacterium]